MSNRLSRPSGHRKLHKRHHPVDDYEGGLPADHAPRAATAQALSAPERLRALGRRPAPWSTVVFALVTGLAVGYAVGREVGGRGTPLSAAASAEAPSPPAAAVAAAKPAGNPQGAPGCGEGAEPASGPAYVELAAWNPRKGPKDPKVTIVEFCDFQ